MSVFLRIDINIVAIVLLGTVVLIAYNRLDKQDKLNKVFLSTSLIILLETFFETITCIINGRPEQWLIPVSVFLHLCLFITAPILTYFWYIFISSWVVPSNAISGKKHILLLIPVVFNFIITVLSPMYNLVFFINSSNIYHRGPLFIISAGIIYFYLIYSFGLIFKQKKKIVKQEFLPLIIFGILPIIGGLLQTLFYGVLLMWSTCAFSLVIVYNFLQQRMIHLDYLTGAWTRGSFDYYISQRVKQKGNDKFGVVIIDLDGLKQINDEYGHFEGDCAIKTTVVLIKSALRKTDIVARFGGDEFIIILDCESQEGLEKTLERINFRFMQYNIGSKKKYKLEYSLGAEIFDSRYHSIEELLHHVDNLLYNNKKKKKSCAFS
ncbi:GGDEF domain-containing protein [Candidatus Formimonas warabiya]|uniref:GGDEF domain-containing protein n=1 Tax=Formimonas warabiya TaxID=1761012 RepID=A0A3G1L284_FORW1|nr:GGDEF domain-containing protein [Candidatus Formimonas warabiya]ATW28767.1 GGDEF domain-containing protein [Candidatus Formimonas warabiya]